MYSSPAIGYLIRKNTLRKHRFVIKTKIILASYATLAAYLIIVYFGSAIKDIGRVMINIEPIIYMAIIATIYSIYAITPKRR